MTTETSIFDITTDQFDYAPGDFALFTVTGVSIGGSVEFQVLHVSDPGADGVYGTSDDTLDAGPDEVSGTADDGYGTTGEGHDPFVVTDGGAGDIDGVANGTIVTDWYVNPDDSLNETFLLAADEVQAGVDGLFGTADDVYTGETATTSFTDASGDFSIDFTAAAPNTYNHLTGGGAYNDRTVGVDDDIVESLQGGDFACGDIVTYLVAVTVDDTLQADIDGPQTIEMDFSFLADTTGQSGVALGDIVDVSVNYGTVQNGAGPGGTDSGIIDDGGSVATLTYENLTGPLFQAGSELEGTVQLTDLERGEQVVVRIDVKLFCDPGSNPTGNLQGALTDAELTFITDNTDPENPVEVPVDPAEAIPGGEQTIPFKQIGDIATPELVITKEIVTDDNGTPGDPSDDTTVDSLTITTGDTVTYWYMVENPGGAPLYNVEVIDDAGTPGNAGDDFFVTLIGLTDEDADGQADDLAAGAVVYGTADVTIDEVGTVVNTGTATGDDSIIEPTILTDSDTAEVIAEGVPAIAIDKTFVDVNGDTEQVADSVGDVINYRIDVTNPGDLALDNVVASDPLLGTLSGPTGDADSDGRLDTDETWSYTGSYAVTQDDLDGEGNAGTDFDIDNTASADSDQTDPVTATEEVPLDISAVLAIDKTFIDVTDVNGDTDQTTANEVGDVINYQIDVTNEGNTALDGVVASDPLLGTLSGPTGDADSDGRLDTDETWSYTGSYAVTQDDLDGEGNAGTDFDIDNTASADSDQTDPVTATEEVPLDISAVLAIDKTFIDVTDVNGDTDQTTANEVGDVINYQIDVTNEGNTALDGVVASDPLLGTLSGPTGDADSDGRLDTDETWSYTGSYAVTQDDLDGEGNAGTDFDIDNTASADSDQTDPVTATEEVPLDISAVLAIDKTFIDVTDVNGDTDQTTANEVGDVINYQIDVTNEGNTALDGVVASDPLLGTLSGPTGDADSDGRLDTDETWSYTGSYAVTQDDLDGEGNAGTDFDIDNTASADSDQTDPVTATEEVPLDISAVLAIDKTFIDVTDVNGDTDQTTANEVGDVINYQIDVTNEGNTALDGVVASDPLLGTLSGPTGDADSDGRLDTDETWSYTGSYAVTQDDLDGEGNAGTDFDIDNTASADSDQTDPVTATEEVPLDISAVLAIDKTFIDVTDVNGDTDQTTANEVGDVINYQIDVTNEGNTALDGVVASDPLLGTLSGPTGDADSDGRLDTDETWSYTGSYAVTQDDLDGEGNAGTDFDIDNTASADSDQTDPVTATEEVPLDISAVLAIDKTFIDVTDVNGDTDQTTANEVGDVINYQIDVTNEGNTALDGVVASDPLLGTLSGPTGDADSDGRLDTDETWSYTGSYAVTQDDLDGEGNAGTDFDIDNTASADSDQTDPVTATEEVPLDISAVLAIDKTFIDVTDVNGDTDQTTANEVGDVINYQIDVTNEGNTALDGVVASDPLLGTLSGPTGDADSDGRLDTDETWSYTGSYAVTQDDLDGEGNAGTDFDIDNTASADSDQTDPVTATEEVPLDISAVLAIDKTFIDVTDVNGDTDQTTANEVGDVINYQIDVTNEGNTALDGVVASDPLLGTLSGPTGDADSDGRLDTDETWSYTGSYAVTQDDLDGEGNAGTDFDIDNTASADSDQTDPVTATEEVPLDISAVLAIDKTFIDVTDVNGDTDQTTANEVGDVINYQIDVTNEGNTALDGVVASDPLLGTLSGPTGDADSDGRLDTDETWSYTGSYAVTQDDLDGEGNAGTDFDIDNTASADSDQTDPVTATEEVPLDISAVLAIDKTFIDVTDVNGDTDQTTANEVGDVINYQIDVTNEGNTALDGVVASDPLLGTLSGPTGDADSDGRLDTDETWSYTGSYAVTQDDLDGEGNAGTDFDIDNTASADSDQTDPVTATEEVPLDISAVLAIDKTFIDVTDVNGDTDQTTANEVGDVINYQIDVTNEGNTALDGVVASDPLLGTLSGPTGDADSDGRLDTDETWSYTGSYAVTQDDLDGEGNAGTDFDIDNTASADSDQTDPVTATEEVPLDISAVLAIDKTFIDVTDVNGDTDQTTANEVGDVINYQIDVTNEGNTALDGVVASDPLLGTLSGPTGDADSDGRLDTDETWSYTGSYAVTQDDLDGEGNAGTDFDIDNTASADSDQTDPVTATEEVPLDISAVLAIDKTFIDVTDVNGDTDQTTANEVGDVINYQIDVTNEGNTALDGVVASDPLLGTLSGPTGDADSDGRLDTDETWSYTGSYAVTQADLDSNGTIEPDNQVPGFIDNTATADSDQTDPVSDTEAVPIVQDPAITIDKVTNGDDGQTILAGTAITWTYTVANAGNVTLTDPLVTDDNGTPGDTSDDFNPSYVSGDADSDGELDVGETWIYEAAGIAGIGDYGNIGTATGDYFDGVDPQQVSAEDPSSYFGANPLIDVEKLVFDTYAGEYVDADTAPGALVAQGNDPQFIFEVENTGNVAFDSFTLSDSQGLTPVFVDGDTDDDGTLDPGETWNYEATGTWAQGQQTNTAEVTGTFTDDLNNVATPSDTDDANYFGIDNPQNQRSLSVDLPRKDGIKDGVFLDQDGDFHGVATLTNESNDGTAAGDPLVSEFVTELAWTFEEQVGTGRNKSFQPVSEDEYELTDLWNDLDGDGIHDLGEEKIDFSVVVNDGADGISPDLDMLTIETFIEVADSVNLGFEFDFSAGADPDVPDPLNVTLTAVDFQGRDFSDTESYSDFDTLIV